jgi:hypothetical protein
VGIAHLIFERTANRVLTQSAPASGLAGYRIV